MRPPRLMYVTDPSTCAWDVVDVARAAADGGADSVQVRGFPGDRAAWEAACRLVEAVGSRMAVLVNERFDVALAAGAAGVHLKDRGLSPREVRAAARASGAAGDFLVGQSAHDAAGLRRAIAEGACPVTLGPLHDCPGKPGHGAAVVQGWIAGLPTGGTPAAILLLGGVAPEDARLARAWSSAGVQVGLASIRLFQQAGSLAEITARVGRVAEALGGEGEAEGDGGRGGGRGPLQ